MAGIRHFEERVVEHRRVRLRGAAAARAAHAALRVEEVLRRGLDRAQLAVVALVRLAEDREVRGLLGMDADHVRLRHLRLDRHRVELRELQDHGRLLLRDHRLAFLRDDRDHFAVHRRDDPRIAEVRARGLDLDARRADLRVERGEARALHVERRGRGFVVLARGRVVGQHLLLPPERELGLLELRGARALLRDEVLDVRLGLAQLVSRDHRIDLGEPLILRHLVAELHLQRFQLAGHLRADVDLLERVQRAGGEHRVLEIGAGDVRGEVMRRLVFRHEAVIEQGERDEHDAAGRYGDPAALGFFHGRRDGNAWQAIVMKMKPDIGMRNGRRVQFSDKFPQYFDSS